MPKLFIGNSLQFPNISERMKSLNILEEKLVALRIPFMSIVPLPSGGQLKVNSGIINVPCNVNKTLRCLPRPVDESHTIFVNLRRGLTYSKPYLSRNVDMCKVYVLFT